MVDDPNKQLAPPPLITTSGMKVALSSNQTSFKEGHVPHPGSGRPKGSRNRVKYDLSQLILDAAAKAGFMQLDKDGKRIATGVEGRDRCGC
jgi:hypothetical protein